jgi:hypothetical protein
MALCGRLRLVPIHAPTPPIGLDSPLLAQWHPIRPATEAPAQGVGMRVSDEQYRGAQRRHVTIPSGLDPDLGP